MNRLDYPEIRIKNAFLVRENVSVHLNELWGEGKPMVSDEGMEKIVSSYREAWAEYEQKIIKGLYEITGLEFYQNTIDVYIAPWFIAFSDPMIIGITNSPDEFIDTLTHELIHRLLTDNKSLPIETNYLDSWERVFGKGHSFIALVHIPVHAIHRAVAADVLNESSRIDRDIEYCKQHNAAEYLKAWDYVNENGYQEIITTLKSIYSG